MTAFASMCLVAVFAAEPASAPRATAEAYLASAYAATAGREHVLHARSEGGAAASDWDEDVYEPTWDAAIVVRTPPRVVGDAMQGAKATADVAFTPVARVEVGGKIVPAGGAAEERKTLALALDGGRWWVVDPGTPIIGLDALIAAYHAEVKQLPSGGTEATSAAQKASRARLLENLARLEALRAAH